jgi:hypothetical protein
VSDEFWTVELVSAESTDPATGDQAVWPAEGQLYPERLAVWQEQHSVDVEYSP